MKHLRNVFYQLLIIYPLLTAALIKTAHVPALSIFLLGLVISISVYTIGDMIVLPREGVLGVILVDFFLVFFITGIGLDIWGLYGYKNILHTLLISVLITVCQGIYHKFICKGLPKKKSINF
ncbi:DUF2512 family protein [Peribacillus deserti]|uniref:DUF2512 domain-containing protein n=1 Tax=Peribacillus deserti TaxID=673318 RepID=A0A2N5M7Y9_9BACI|nr:DUF2512 family protein [Peribacillus deserti]PLT30466.1 hypothetical protein CUU66_07330 [Peribacillus deserti]